jgi:hypothetical protein
MADVAAVLRGGSSLVALHTVRRRDERPAGRPQTKAGASMASRMLKKEAHHLGAGVGSGGISATSPRAAARPRMWCAMDRPEFWINAALRL